MKLTAKERKAIDLLRRLDGPQREEMLNRMSRQVLANEIVVRAARVRQLKVAPDRKVEQAFGSVPIWRSKRGRAP